MTNLTIEFTPDELAVIDEAAGVLRTDAFIRRSAVEKAKRLLAISTPEERYGAAPVFDE
jgi:uncharacterized protein (DUF1778 family)